MGMTVRAVAADGGEEVLPALSAVWDQKRNALVVRRVIETVEEVLLSEGYAFVMNDLGKTVAIYDIGKRQQQQKEQQNGDRKSSNGG